jgi:hypothetical protein
MAAEPGESDPSLASHSAWRRKQDTPVPIPFSLAYALWDFCCAKGGTVEARHLMDAINAVFPGYFEPHRD